MFKLVRVICTVSAFLQYVYHVVHVHIVYMFILHVYDVSFMLTGRWNGVPMTARRKGYQPETAV